MNENPFSNNYFNELMSDFVKLDNETKRKNIIKEIKKLISYEILLCQYNNTKIDLLYNKEIKDLDNIPLSEKDFLEGLFAYIYILKYANNEYIKSEAKKINELINFYNK